MDLAGLSEQLRKEGLTEKETCEQRTQTGEKKWLIWVSQGKAVTTAGKAAGMEDLRLMCEGGDEGWGQRSRAQVLTDQVERL